jgi:nucleotidyltransferase/DNA polymerase involved in DNA repair
MKAQYHINVENYSLHTFKRNLETREMIPSRVSLKDNLDERFSVLESTGITNLKELMDVLKTKSRIEHFSEETGLSIPYLTLLNREAKSYLPNPVRLDKFPGIASTVIEKLEVVGIKNSRHLFNAAQNKAEREKLAQETEIPIILLDELVGLSDLARIYGVGPVFARMIHDVGIKSLREFVHYSAEDFIEIYETQTQKKADFGVNEIELSLVLARELDIAVEI